MSNPIQLTFPTVLVEATVKFLTSSTEFFSAGTDAARLYLSRTVRAAENGQKALSEIAKLHARLSKLEQQASFKRPPPPPQQQQNRQPQVIEVKVEDPPPAPMELTTVVAGPMVITRFEKKNKYRDNRDNRRDMKQGTTPLSPEKAAVALVEAEEQRAAPHVEAGPLTFKPFSALTEMVDKASE